MKFSPDESDLTDGPRFAVAPDRYSAKQMVKPVTFAFAAPNARQVHLIGDFNDWDPKSHPMKRRSDGTWQIQVPLNHGHHHYQFLADGKAILDPCAQGIARDHRNEKVSLLAVS